MMEMHQNLPDEFVDKKKCVEPIHDIADPMLPLFQAYFDLLVAHAAYVKQHESRKKVREDETGEAENAAVRT